MRFPSFVTVRFDNEPLGDRFDKINAALKELKELLMTTKQQVEDLATEVRSYITDVKADSQTLADKVAALEAGADNADADQLAALIAEVKDAHKALDATITAAPAAVTSGDTTDGTTGDTTGSSGG